MNPDLPWLEEELAAHSQWVRRLARSLVHDESAAEDLVQDTWVAALRRPPADRRALRGWLARVVRTLAWKQQRKVSTAPLSAEEGSLPGRASDSELVERLELHRVLAEELRAIREPLRTTLLQRYFEGLSAAQIAERTGTPAPSVRWRLQQGLEELRTRLDARFGGKRDTWMSALAFALPAKWAVLGGSGIAIGEGVLMTTLMKVSIGAAVLAIAMLLARPLLFEGEQPTQAVAKDSATPTAQPEGVKQPATAEEEESARTLLVEDSQRAAANAPALDPRRVRILARILDQDRRPLPGAWLAEDEEQFFSTRAIPRRGAAQRAAPERSLSDPAGEVVYERGATSSRESLRLAAGAPGHVSAHLQALVRGGEIVFLGDIQLGPASSVSGRVIDEAGSPLAGIEVTALRAGTVQRARSADVAAVVLEPGMMAGEIAPHTVSGADGAFELNEVSPGVIRIWGRLEGNRWAHAGPLQLEAGVPLEHVEVLAVRPPAAESAKYEIHGLVLQPDGSPFEGVSVRAAGRSGGSMEARSGKDGRFVLSTSTRGPFFLSAHFMNAKRRYRDVQRRGVVPGPEEIELRFEEPRWMSIEVLADGAPCPEFVVFTTSAGRRSGAQLDRAPGEASNKGRLLLPDGEFGLRVEAPGFAAAEVGPFEQGSAPESVHIELHAPASVTGHVFSNRSPVAGAKMELIPALVDDEGYVDSFLTTYDTLHSVSSRTDESGAFHASVVDPGQYHVCVTAEGFARSDSGALSIDPTRGLEGLVIELDQGGSLEGTVLVAKDLTPAGIIVSLNRGDGMPRTQRVGPDGRFRFERLTPGPWVLARSDREAREEAESSTFSGGHGSSVSLPFNCTIRGGSTTKQDLDLRADRPCSLSGRLSIQGSPAWAWSVARTTHSGKKIYQGWMGSADLDSAGKFMLEVESPGEWTLELHSPPEAQASMTLLVTLPLVAGKNEWTFDVPAGRLEGRVLSPHDPSTRIRTHPSGLGEANVALELASDGTFVVPVLPAGPGEIVEDQPGSPEPRVLARFTVAAGSTTRIDVP